MQLTRLRMFGTQCEQELLAEDATLVEIYHRDGSEWLDLDSKKVSPVLSADLSFAFLSGRSHRRPSKKDTYFPVPEADAVVRSAFKVAVREPRREQLHRLVLRSFLNASNAYEAEYHQLTGLLGKKALLRWLRKALTTGTKPATQASAPIGVPAGKAVAVIAIDIDFFKQVNDSYGHPYGDLVLIAFAMRLQETIRSFVEATGPALEAVACHASGEEFFCLATGDVESVVFEELAERIRESISSKLTPDESQLQVLLRSVPKDSVTIPPPHARKISCSLGLVIAGTATSTAGDVATGMLKQADMALYRAKTLGRDRKVLFTSILERCGRVIEDRAEVGVLTIDIGSDVGVKKGQEFLVFHPDFTGQTPFTIDDGRSKRVVGRYPRVPFCRVSAFEVQSQLSFCRRTDGGTTHLVPVGSILEAIPLGSIGHLFASSAGVTGGLDEWLRPEAESKKFFEQSVLTPKASVLALRIVNQDDLLEKRGADFINRVLAACVESLRDICIPVRFAGSIEQTEIALVDDTGNAFDDKKLTGAIDSVSRAMGGLPVFSVGIFRPTAMGDKEHWGPPKYDGRLQLARYTSAYPKDATKNSLEQFSKEVTDRILTSARDGRDVVRGLADFERLTELGCNYASMWNQAGLMVVDKGDFNGAIKYFAKASQLNPQNSAMRRNLFSMHMWCKEYDKAAPVLHESDKIELFEDSTAHVVAARCIVDLMLHIARHSQSTTDKETATRWVRKLGPTSEGQLSQWIPALSDLGVQY